eukprot:GEMP01020791.1.p1 GENE.GEMP01020791.1~~GEMP01020791.1.p1  ORF type:complete len:476 (+),score=112.16 GEMP01020791.1:289-1716(+)
MTKVVGKVPKVAPERYRDMAPSGVQNEMSAQEKALRNAIESFRGPMDDDEDEPVMMKGGPWVDKLWFNGAIGFVVFLNMVWIGIELDFGYKFTNEELLLPPAEKMQKRLKWWLVENFFCILFVWELFLRIRTYRAHFFFDAFNVVDMGLVMVACLDTYILTFVGQSGNLRVISALRIVRLIRLVRFVRLLKAFKEIWLIVQTMGNSIRALVWVGLLMFFILYMSAIFLTSYIGQNDAVYDVEPEDPDTPKFPHKIYFGTVPRSMFTLFQVATLDNWCDGIVRRVSEKQIAMAFFFVFFIILTSFGLLNVIVGVIVENTLSVARSQEQSKVKQKELENKVILQELRELFLLSDRDCSGALSLAEFKTSFETDAIRNKFQNLRMPGTDAEEIFSLLDPMNKGFVKLDDFIASLSLLLGGTEMANNITQVVLQVETLSRRMDGLDESLNELEDAVKSIRGKTSEFLRITLPLISGVQV